jgi:hypothetical protein
MKIIMSLAEEYNIDLNTHIISVFYEWCGGNIQAKSALTGIEKKSIIFAHFKTSPIEHQESVNDEFSVWYETKITKDGEQWVSNNENGIYNIMNFPTYKVSIDFETPLLSQNEMIKLVEEVVEPASPVGKMFGQEKNIGEGIVFTFLLNGTLQKFKVKGNEHSNSRVTTLKPVDNVKEQSKIDFANYAANALRLEQAWQNTFGIENEKQEPTVKSMGQFLKAVMGDIVKEESDILVEKGLEPHDVSNHVNNIARRWFQTELDKFIIGK